MGSQTTSPQCVEPKIIIIIIIRSALTLSMGWQEWYLACKNGSELFYRKMVNPGKPGKWLLKRACSYYSSDSVCVCVC